jgi:FKBP-type peptidyl-prolyl cis-trans isomerase
MHIRDVPWFHRALALATLALAAQVTLAQLPAPATTAPSAPAAAAAPTAAPPPLDPVAGSYSIGLYFGNQLGSAGLASTLSVDELIRGLKEGLAGKRPADEEKARMSQMLREGRDAVAAHNHAAARQFMAENGKIAGVVTTASGLQYTEVKPGDPKATTPKPTDRVTVQYRGRLLDGSEFDSSERHAQAATFALTGGAIKGWREALLLMKPGAQWRVFIPPELAYDANPPPGIPPGALLVFDVELVKIEPAQVMGPQAPKAQMSVKPAAAKAPAPAKPNP